MSCGPVDNRNCNLPEIHSMSSLDVVSAVIEPV